ncbi:TPA: hypothetical protein I1891_001921 [Staphylococcus pseudintermedius]|uniref:phage minor capsid protein n=1 Tax=Staphylococcus pseudintermedius TaxID=283734 RepID=UPI0018F5AB7B|nr:phage minor capsid protein [Staphylococcus pseudintermedius]EHS7224099.1 hypothetical protein [Staphylococcus pseudintermedius]EIT0992936.1 hypothetical protein [Staphylococcus pseudintermedius]EIU0346631.1 hypothetical protein [Staphylococcus pseudintermedius]EJL7992621.1 hypothetical protein [Staphylococcus pseudintermedius]EKO9286522.1 hypothetical protein [Staphylococcus pseudintermedius]
MTPEQIKILIRYLLQKIDIYIKQTDITDEQQIKKLYKRVDTLFKELDAGLSNTIPKELYNDYLQGLSDAQKLLIQESVIAAATKFNPKQVINSAIHVTSLTNIVTDTMLDLTAAVRTAKVNANKNIKKVLYDVNKEINNGLLVGMPNKEVSKRVANKFADEKLTAFVTKDGKHLPLDFYAETVTRTKKQTAYNHSHLNRYKEHNVKHVYVTGNIPTCETCARYRGKVFATERGDKFPYINLYKTFPLHPNCRCNFRPFILKFKNKSEIDMHLKKSKTFNVDDDPRTKEEKEKYDNIQKAQAKARRQALSYNKMQRRLGKNGPESLNEYIKVKNTDKVKYYDWVAKMKGLLPKDKDVTINKTGPIEKPNFKMTDKKIRKLKEAGELWAKDLTENEFIAVSKYTLMDYEYINNYLRGVITGIDDDQKELINSISVALNKFKLTEPIQVYRSIDISEYEYLIDNKKSNAFLSFTSTSIDKEVAENIDDRAKILKIDVPKGAKGAYLEFVSEFSEELEFLLDKNTRFKIISDNEATGVLHLEVLT